MVSPSLHSDGESGPRITVDGIGWLGEELRMNRTIPSSPTFKTGGSYGKFERPHCRGYRLETRQQGILSVLLPAYESNRLTNTWEPESWQASIGNQSEHVLIGESSADFEEDGATPEEAVMRLRTSLQNYYEKQDISNDAEAC